MKGELAERAQENFCFAHLGALTDEFAHRRVTDN